MFDAWREKSRKEKEAKWLAEITARDADVGVPSSKTLSERMRKAAIGRMWNVVDDCLQKGADVREELKVSRKWASDNYFPGIAKVGGLGLYSDRDVSLVCIAVIHNDVKAAQSLLAQGGDPSAGYSGWNESFTPLSIAVGYNNAAMVQMLCDNGADLVWDKPLRLAEEKGYNDIIKIIRAEETKRAQNSGKPLPAPPPTATEKVMGTLERLSDDERAKLLAAVNEKFGPPKADAAVLEQGIVVQKPLTLKKQA